MTTLLVIALVGAVVLTVFVWARSEVYRSRHPYSKVDLDKARKEALKRSQASVSGKVGEHFAPIFPSFLERFNPRDAKFLGNPVDFVIFDGLEAGDLREVVLVEVKTGRSAKLDDRQRRVRDCVDAGHVRFETLKLLDGSTDAVTPVSVSDSQS